MPDPIVAERLTKRYRLRREGGRTLKELILGQYAPAEEVTALRDASFNVAEGETVGVIGANGSGKSTLLKLVAGTSRPTSGRLQVHGRVSALLEIGTGFHPDFSGRENAYLNGSILGLSRKEMDRAMPSIEEFADLGRFFDAPVKTYSSGMYMRLGFAVAVHLNPDILLIDEVLAVGDEYFQHKCFSKINEFRALKKTILFVSHDLGAVRRICDRAIALEQGRVLVEGDVSYVVETYEETVRAKERGVLAAAGPAQAAGRWGTRAVDIRAVRVLDAEGRDSRVLRSGEPATIEIEFRAQRELDDVTFGVLLYRDDGLGVYGTNTTIDGARVAVSPGEGRVRLRLERVELLDGMYLMDVAAHAPDESETYDYHLKRYPFRVYGAGRETGIVRLAHRWEIGGDGATS